ncbi:DUF3742 family protein [Pseudomonas benzopyrenica]|uniref:DUF3742 family protein n=1 Tax=Pseudomonas benzopyrenica TaxID=2993566 RepID=UPI0039C05E6E
MASSNSTAARLGALAGRFLVRLGSVESAVWRAVQALGLPSHLCVLGMWLVRISIGAALAFFSFVGLLLITGLIATALLASTLSRSSFKPSDCVQSFEYDHYSNGHHYKDGVRID